MPSALVTGITGQDGSYLADTLTQQGWDVHGVVRAERADEEQLPLDSVTTHLGDLTDLDGLARIVDEVEPDAVFNLAGISSVAQSWERPLLTAQVTGVAATAMLDAAWKLQERLGREVRFVQASSSEIFGHAEVLPQTEATPIAPVSPYGAAKAFAHHATGVYRGRGLPASAAILYNHESPRRPLAFVTRKITHEVARISLGLSDRLTLGNLDVERDWGWAPDYVDALVRMADPASQAGSYIIATGVAHSVRDFLTAAFARVGIADWSALVGLDERFARPVETPTMVGDPSKARDLLGWSPTVGFDDLVGRMVDSDLEALRAQS
jgi:GDPmannose 4,6-dehydratase